MNDLFKPDDTRDALRKIGGLLFGLGAAMIYIRKGPFLTVNPSQWASFPMFLVLAIPAVYLYGAILTRPRTGELRSWQLVHSVFGLIFAVLALTQFVHLIGGNPNAPLNLFWIFLVVAGLAFYVGAVVGVRVQLLLGGIALIISWTGLWDKLLSGGIGAHWGVYRGLLGLIAIGLLAGGLYLWRNNPGGDEVAATATGPSGDLGLWKASELLTAAGIAAVVACSLGITALGNLNPLGTGTPPIETTNAWDVLLLIVSIGLVAIGSTDRREGAGLRRGDRAGALPRDRRARSQLDAAAPVQARRLAMGPARARGDRYRPQLHPGGEPRRSAAESRTDPAR